VKRCNDALVRTTISIDEDVLRAARALATAQRRIGSEYGFPVFQVDADAPLITPEMVGPALDEPSPTCLTSTC
jgi:hypothetical protein